MAACRNSAGGRDSVELCVAEVAVLPIQASHFDPWTIEQLARLVESARGFNTELRALCVISHGSTQVSNADAAELIAEFPALQTDKDHFPGQACV